MGGVIGYWKQICWLISLIATGGGQSALATTNDEILQPLNEYVEAIASEQYADWQRVVVLLDFERAVPVVHGLVYMVDGQWRAFDLSPLPERYWHFLAEHNRLSDAVKVTNIQIDICNPPLAEVPLFVSYRKTLFSGHDLTGNLTDTDRNEIASGLISVCP